MERDFRIVTKQGEAWVSEVVKRREAIFTPPVAVGLVVGTFAAVPYIHLHLEARRRLYPHIPLLVHDDASPKQHELRRLCEEYGCEFESNDTRQPLFIGDISCLLGGLLWGQSSQLDIVVKMSRRFVPLINWATRLQELALASQYPTYSHVTASFGLGFRTECVGMAVNEWIDNRVHEQLATIALAPGTPFVEGVVHNFARRLAEFRCERAKRWDHIVGPRPDDRNGYAPWDFMGTDRGERYPQFLWHHAAPPDGYFAQAQEWGLPYSHDDFVDPNQGFGAEAQTS